MSKRLISYAKLIASMLIWGSLALFVRKIHYSSAEIVLGRVCLGLLFLGTIYAFSRKKSPRSELKRNLPRLLITGAAMGLNWAALFEAYRYVDVSIATLCYYMAPMFVVLGSLLFFREKISAPKLIGTLAAVAGMVVVTGAVMGGTNPMRGVLFGLLSALLYASMTLSNKCVRGLSGLQITIFQLLGALAVILPYVLIFHEGAWRAPEPAELVSLVLLGFVHTGVALYLYFSAIQELPVQSVALLSYIDPLSALGFAALFLGDRLSAVQLAGAALILGGAVFGECARRPKNA